MCVLEGGIRILKVNYVGALIVGFQGGSGRTRMGLRIPEVEDVDLG